MKWSRDVIIELLAALVVYKEGRCTGETDIGDLSPDTSPLGYDNSRIPIAEGCIEKIKDGLWANDPDLQRDQCGIAARGRGVDGLVEGVRAAWISRGN
jgi:hypothetical protein